MILKKFTAFWVELWKNTRTLCHRHLTRKIHHSSCEISHLTRESWLKIGEKKPHIRPLMKKKNAICVWCLQGEEEIRRKNPWHFPNIFAFALIFKKQYTIQKKISMPCRRWNFDFITLFYHFFALFLIFCMLLTSKKKVPQHFQK